MVRTVFLANPAKPALRAGFAGFAVVARLLIALGAPQPRLKASVRSIVRYQITSVAAKTD
jgi:hypothetical protein